MTSASVGLSATPELLNCLSEDELRELLSLLEQERADQAKESLTDYVKQVDMPGAPVVDIDGEETGEYYPERLQPALHHELIIDKLEAVERGDLKRLMILMGPGTAKSTYATVAFPTWYLGKRPRRQIGCFSYGDVLSRQFGGRCQQLVGSPEYEQIFGVAPVHRRVAALEWQLTNGSTYFASGILGGITGRRLDGAVS